MDEKQRDALTALGVGRHFFVTPHEDDEYFYSNRFCRECGEYLTHENHHFELTKLLEDKEK